MPDCARPRRIRAASVWLLAVAVALAGCQSYGTRSASSPSCAVYFSPRGGCTEHLVEEIAQAKERIVVQAYSFTSQPIARALVAASKRGVQVEAILDKSQATDERSAAGLMAQAGIPVDIDAAHAIAHNKVMVIDGRTIITGSFNFTESAEARNAENLLVIRDEALATQYAKNWETHRAHSTRYHR